MKTMGDARHRFLMRDGRHTGGREGGYAPQRPRKSSDSTTTPIIQKHEIAKKNAKY